MKTKRLALKPVVRLMAAVVIPTLALTSVAMAQGGRYQTKDAWTFAVTADTQWTITHSLSWDDDDPYYAHVNPNYREENPDYVSVATLLRLNEEFINHGVRFVVQLGDLTDRAGNAAMYTHAAARQPLYDAGIGFFPVRGNHETYGFLYGLDPDPADPDQVWPDMNIPAWHEAFPQTRGLGPNLVGAYNFHGPDIPALEGLSYSFDFGPAGSDARFVFMDIEPTSYWLEEPELHPVYGAPYIFNNIFDWTVYKHDEDVIAGNGDVIPAGTWFRVASNGTPAISWVEEATDETVVLDEGDFTYDGTQFRPGDQQEWINNRLEDHKRPAHAFVLSHRNLMGQNHINTVWGSNPGVTPDAQNTFFRSLQENNVGYMLSAHDHMHNRSIVRSPDGEWAIEQLIASSSDPKFYTPASGTQGGQRWRETPISQELANIGFYIFTVDGARMTVDYFSDRYGNFGTDYCWPDGYPGPDGACSDPRFGDQPERMGSLSLPNFFFEHKDTWGYGLNGQRFIVPQGVSYAGDTVVGEDDEVTEYPRVQDSFKGTHAQILAGYNGSDATDNVPDAPRALSKTVTTGWTANPDTGKLKSDILSLWGMGELNVEETDVFVLSMSFDFKNMNQLGTGAIGIATYVNDEWVNAVDQNFGGHKNFVVGPYVDGVHELGTYGVDPSTKTAWAVLNYNADFAVANAIEKVPGADKPPVDKPKPPSSVTEAIARIHARVASLFRAIRIRLFG